MNLAIYVGLQHSASGTLGDSLRQVAAGHGDEPDVRRTCENLARQCDGHVARLDPIAQRYGEQRDDEPERLHADGLSETRSGPVGLLRDLQDLYTLAGFVDITWTVLLQAAQAVRDQELVDAVSQCEQDTQVQLRWLRTRIKQAAAQALVAASGT